MLSDLSQVDPSDLSMLFAGAGRLRIGFAEIDPPDGGEPTEEQVEKAVNVCWSNPYSLFSKPVGTSLVCIQGQWSNVIDGRLKGGLAALATAGAGQCDLQPLARVRARRAEALGDHRFVRRVHRKSSAARDRLAGRACLPSVVGDELRRKTSGRRGRN